MVRVVAILLVGEPVFAFSAPVTAEEIIRNSVQANERDWQAAPKYSYTEVTRDSHGSKTNQVIMLFGSPYRRLLKVNGKALSRDDQKREQQKFDAARSERRSKSEQAAAHRIAEYE
ncbi:MAG: hypothetical protein M3Z09_17145, partial [Acidobacteriota bacterium]|nr:hypothetical protein [Acidobacteriota bacterium]